MTFEEFLIKKKIDLAQFQTAEPGLFTEFQSHYSQMGPKSFDHTKKFLFNKLRRAYHLKEEPKPVPVKEVVEINEIAAQAEPLLSPTVEATVYTPRFRAGGTVKEEPGGESGKRKAESGTGDAAKPAYVPRFKAAGTTKASPQTPSSPETSDLRPQTSDNSPQTSDQPKPAYVPRFKAPVTTKPAEEPKEETADKPKPAYVPRFKAPVTAKEEPEGESGKREAESKTGDAAKPAYVPRFKAPVTKQQAPEASELRPQTSENSPQISDPGPAEEPKEEIADKPKPAYVPRFKPPKPQ
ncbi:MAG: hypothetical protein V4721_04660 [Bacteroidota bacterium]